MKLTRRDLLQAGLGGLALRSLDASPGYAADAPAKRAIWLFMGGGPSQHETFDFKPGLANRFDEDLPASVRKDHRVSGMTSQQGRFPIVPSKWGFAPAGQSGMAISELLPWTARIADELTLVKTVTTSSINHDPAMMMMNTGAEMPGKASFGSWLSYGLGRASEELPTYVVMTSRSSSKAFVQALSSHLWGNGFLPPQHAGVSVRGVGAPLLYVDNPPGVDSAMRRAMLDGLKELEEAKTERFATSEAHLDRYELAFKMQRSVPELVDVSSELSAARALYGDDVATPGTFAANCLLARRMIERGVRFVQVYHRGWDAHINLPAHYPGQCADIDHACYGLVTDLKQRGLLEDTMVIWGGEFGRTVFAQGNPTRDVYGRDHHGGCFPMWFAGAGFKRGVTVGETDDFSYNVVRDPLPVRDLHATLLWRFGLDPQRLAFPVSGLDQKLVGVGPPARIATELFR